MLVCPGAHGVEDWCEVSAGGGEFVDDFGGYAAVVGAGGDAEFHESFEPGGQCFWADAAESGLEFAEPAGADEEKFADDEGVPGAVERAVEAAYGAGFSAHVACEAPELIGERF